ncbi:hypothetical protein Lal_00010899 [Lupinus albus]|nr:hypothetical protein Lal_00010899 [Lupinus albus]
MIFSSTRTVFGLTGYTSRKGWSLPLLRLCQVHITKIVCYTFGKTSSNVLRTRSSEVLCEK